MPLTILPSELAEPHNFSEDYLDTFMDWKYWDDWCNSLTPWEVTNAVEGIFEEHNVAESVVHLRALVTEENFPLCKVFGPRLIGRLVVLLKRHKHLHLQLEAIRTLVCMGRTWWDTPDLLAVHSGVFVDLLSCTNAMLRENAVHILCMLVRNHDEVMEHRVINALFRVACSAQSPPELETAVHALSRQISYLKRATEFKLIGPDMPTLVMFLHSTNPKVVRSAAVAMEKLTSLPSATMDVALQASVLCRTAELVRQTPKRDNLLHISLDIVGNIARRSEQHVVIDHDLLSLLRSTLESDFVPTRLLACRAIAHVCAGTQHQVQRVIEMDVFADLLAIMRSNDDSFVVCEAARAFANATSRASSEQMQFFMGLGCVQALLPFVGPKFRKHLVEPAFRALSNFLKYAETQGASERNVIAALVKEAILSIDCRTWQARAASVPKAEVLFMIHVMELCGVESMLPQPPTA